MTRNPYGWKPQGLWLVVVFAGLCFLQGATCLWAQKEQVADRDSEQLCGVVRVSWHLIETIAEEQVATEIPFQSPLSRGRVSGNVVSQIDLTIERCDESSTTSDENAVFFVKVAGKAKGNFSAIAGPFGISGPITVDFEAAQEVTFDGRLFAVSDARVKATVTTRVRTIRGRRNGPLGRAIAYVARPIVEREVANTKMEASRMASEYISDYVNQFTTELTSRLNKVTPIEESLFRLYPKMAEWRIRIKPDDDYLDVRYAPPGSDPLQLPQAPHGNAGVEIWIRTTAAEAKFLERVGNWKQLQSLMAEYLPDEGSEARKLTSGTTVRSFGPWFALLIGELHPDSLAEPKIASTRSPVPSP